MQEVKSEKAICKNCGVDVRENTAFCYNCGNSVMAVEDEQPPQDADPSDEPADDAKTALEDLAERLKLDEPAENDKLAKAAVKRRNARIVNRKSKEYSWEPIDDSGRNPIILFAFLITVIAVAVVFLAVVWK